METGPVPVSFSSIHIGDSSMLDKKKLKLRCPHCGGTKFHLENPGIHYRALKAVYRAPDGSITVKLGPEQIEQNEKLVLWCRDCPDDFSVRGWDEEEVVRELLDEMESAGLTP